MEVFPEGKPEKPQTEILVILSSYLSILAGAFLFPILLSFDKKVAFYRKWRYLFPAMLLTALVFIPWDIHFTRKNIWGFSPEHLTGLRILSLPVEEWLFFLVIPYASVFTYEVVRTYFRRIRGVRTARLISLVFLGAALVIVLVFRDRAYTIYTFGLMALLMALHLWVLKKDWMLSFYVSYLLVLIPFMIVNGILTGTGVPGEVVWYDNAETMGIRIATIPLEDVFYGFGLVLMNVTLYEMFKTHGPESSGNTNKIQI
jgi:lycopene cyclase domain-containing protein